MADRRHETVEQGSQIVQRPNFNLGAVAGQIHIRPGPSPRSSFSAQFSAAAASVEPKRRAVPVSGHHRREAPARVAHSQSWIKISWQSASQDSWLSKRKGRAYKKSADLYCMTAFPQFAISGIQNLPEFCTYLAADQLRRILQICTSPRSSCRSNGGKVQICHTRCTWA